jgi:Cd2+/Zn2+-exporting ATPase
MYLCNRYNFMDKQLNIQQLKKHFQALLPVEISLVLLLTGIVFQHLESGFFSGLLPLIWFAAAYLPVGFPVIKEAAEHIAKGDVFTEFLLMSIATAGAFAIGRYPEAVAVMLFYAAGEFFQDMAVGRAQANIKNLIDQRPDTVHLVDGDNLRTIHAKQTPVGSIIRLKPGEKLALDGTLLSDYAAFNTSALTGESRPENKQSGDVVLAGMINLSTPATIRVTTSYEDSKLSKILQLVQDATKQKAPAELFIRKFARYYTPAVVATAALICVMPLFFVRQYVFSEWLYRGLIFLVISCPCALVISVPLSYFGGIGAASRRGILFKGSNYLDSIASIRHIVLDKTGTLTQGVFKVKEVVIQPGFDPTEVLSLVTVLESHSNHPIATAITAYAGAGNTGRTCSDVEEIAGYGLTGTVDSKKILAGNSKLLDQHAIHHRIRSEDDTYTVVNIAIDGRFAGYITLGDRLKPDALQTIEQLKQSGIRTTILSGDKDKVVQHIAATLGIDGAYGNLFPEDKVVRIQEIKHHNEKIAFVGDGVNDAPAIAFSDVGIAMGGLGSDAAIEIADIVIQNDEPSSIPVAIRIGKATRQIVWQNILLAIGVKLAILLLGAIGAANMWEAVFADVGVTFLAILNAMRLLRKKF